MEFDINTQDKKKKGGTNPQVVPLTPQEVEWMRMYGLTKEQVVRRRGENCGDTTREPGSNRRERDN